MISKARYLPYPVALVAIASSFYFKEMHWLPYGASRIPLPIRELIGPPFVVLLPWNGWVFLIPLLTALFIGLRKLEIAILWIGMSLVMGITHAVVSFSTPLTLARCMRGVAFYMILFGIVWLFGEAFYWIAKRTRQARQ